VTPLRRRNARSIRESQGIPAMTPMVDVTLVILIFFMASAVIGGREWFLETAIASNSAHSDRPASLPEAVFVVKVVPGAEGGLIEGFGLGVLPAHEFAATLPAALKGLDPAALRVVLEPSPSAAYGHVVAAREALDAAGVRDVGIR